LSNSGPAVRLYREGKGNRPARSANLVQTLIKHDLVDAFWLKIYPITLGGGKRLFADGTIPAAFKVTESTVTSKGVIIVNYERAGAVPTGSL
jgi:dihydrofolate reductase